MSANSPSSFLLHERPGAAPIKAWTRGVPVDDRALEQLEAAARLPFIHHHVAAMPDVHVGIGATVGSVIPTRGAVIPAAVGVDIGCGMMAVRTSLEARDLPDSLAGMRQSIERAVPHGRTSTRGRGRSGGRVSARDKGSWGDVPSRVARAWSEAAGPRRRSLSERLERIATKHPSVARANHVVHLGTLGTGNHFIEVCLDERERVWLMLHSGSRGVGNHIGRHFIELAKADIERKGLSLPDRDLAYLEEGSDHFRDYIEAVSWAQDYARRNRELMMDAAVDAVRAADRVPPFTLDALAVNCHHNYVAEEEHFGERCLVTRKGAVRAGRGELGIIPGSMGARSFIVRGKGNPESFESCSHGAGRVMSRSAAKRAITLEQHAADTAGVECRKDAGVIDESPRAYKPIEAVMAAQADLVEVVHTLRQVVCVKG